MSSRANFFHSVGICFAKNTSIGVFGRDSYGIRRLVYITYSDAYPISLLGIRGFAYSIIESVSDELGADPEAIGELVTGVVAIMQQEACVLEEIV